MVGKTETKLDIARKAFIMLLYGIEPTPHERLEDYVKRGDRILKKLVSEEKYVDESL